MKVAFYCLSLILLAADVSVAQTAAETPPGIVKIDARPDRGFAYPFYLYVPKALREDAAGGKQTRTLLVLPNNSGKLNDDLNAHEEDVKRKFSRNVEIADRLGVALLTPVFPRPQTHWKIYTHALDRDAMTTDKKEFARFDLQLIAMIDEARARLKREKLKFDERVVMLGFSASGMFVNRFTFLHPKRVKAAAIGSPGGWAIAPAVTHEGKALRYPVGVGDFKSVAGEKFDLKNVRKVPLFVFLGDKDDNDSVVFRDSYEKEDEDLIVAHFGKMPVDRWGATKKLYQEAGLNADFRLYPDVAHSITKSMFDDIFAFVAKHVNGKAK